MSMTTTTAKALADQTPREIDEALEALYLAEMSLDQAVAVATESLHHAAGERKHYQGRSRKGIWLTTTAQAEAAVAALVDGHAAKHQELWCSRCPVDALAAYTTAVTALAANQAQQAPLHAEYARRPWSRYFTCMANGGHVHSSMRCSTCNRGQEMTRFGWTPALSGLTEDEAVALLGDYASSLCTVCFPSAPVERTDGRLRVAANPACPGSGRSEVKGTWKRQGMSAYGRCQECQTIQTVTARGAIRKHKPAAE